MVELKAALARISRDAPNELLRAHKQIGMIVARRAERIAPKGRHEGGGKVVAISKSIKSFPTVQGVVIEAGIGAPQAAPTEWGGTIPRRGWKGRREARHARRLARLYEGKTVTRIKRQPYMMPAVDQTIDQVMGVYRTVVDRVVERFDRP